MLKPGDTQVVKSLDRLSRNNRDIKNELEFFKDHHVRLKVLDLPTTMVELPEDQAWVFDMVNNILIEVLGTIAKQERVTIKQRQLEGIMAAHRRGVVSGRPRIQKPPNWDSVIADLKDGKITSVQAMELTGMKRTSFYKLLADS